MEFYCNWKTLSCFINNSSVLNKGNQDRDEHYALVLAITKACASKTDWFRVPLTSGRGDTIRYSQKNCVCVRGRLPNKTFTLFKTKICDFPCSIYDLTKNLSPYLWPDTSIKPVSELHYNKFPSSDPCINREHNRPFLSLMCLCFKTSLSAKPFIWKWVLNAVSFSCKSKSF